MENIVNTNNVVTPTLLECDVVFVYGTSFTNRIIEFGTHGPSHVALVKNASTLVEANGGRPLGECPLAFYDSVPIEIWRDNTLTETDRSAMLAFAASLYGTPYDYALIPLVGLHSEFGISDNWYHEHGRLICSTFISTVAEHVGKRWARGVNPAPVDEQTSGALNKIYTRDGAGVWST